LRDTFYQRILQSAIKPGNSYVYSDLDFIFLGKVIEKVSGMKLNEYMATHFYNPMRLDDIAFLPNNRFTAERIVASTYEKGFRNQLLKGDVHDPGAAIMGGVSGHAGLFGSAAAIAALMQMLLDTGVVNGNQYLQKNTIQLFTSYQSWNSRRGYGFDKPERVTADKKVPYPAASASPSCFGHTGFTGTATWADPATKLIFVFLSNRLMPEDNDALLKKNIRQKILQAVYEGFSDATVE
jgi:CubicO group peptidase (beta-lactamase class C family)